MTEKELGQKIKLYREQARLSQSQLGAKLGVSYQQVQKYERGVNRLSVDTLLKLARALKAPAVAFLDVTGHTGPKGWGRGAASDSGALTREEQEMIRLLREHRDEKFRGAILALLRSSPGRKPAA